MFQHSVKILMKMSCFWFDKPWAGTTKKRSISRAMGRRPGMKPVEAQTARHDGS